MCRVALLVLFAALAATQMVQGWPEFTADALSADKTAASILETLIPFDRYVRTHNARQSAKNNKQREILPGAVPVPNYSDPIWSLPIAGYITIGRTATNTTGSPQITYTTLSDRTYTLVVHYVNEILGGLLLNGSRYLIRDLHGNDGADCSIMMERYDGYISKGALLLFAPVNPDCSVLSKLAESRDTLFFNAGDYSLLIERLSPNFSTPNDYLLNEYVSNPEDYDYSTLDWTFNAMTIQTVTSLGDAVADALTNPIYIDQTGVPSGAPPRQVRTAAFASNQREVPYNVATQRDALLKRGVTEAYPNTNLDLSLVLSDKCDYLWPTVIDHWIETNPDFAMLITGASNTSIGVMCMHQKHYQPPAFETIATADPANGFDPWHLALGVGELTFLATIEYDDPIFGKYSTWTALYNATYGYLPSFYEDTMASSITVPLGCILSTQSLDPYVIRTCMRNFEGSTVYGNVSYPAETGYAPNRSNIVIQYNADGTFQPVYPIDYPNRVNLVIDEKEFPWNTTWEDQFKSHGGISKRDRSLAIGIPTSIVGVCIIVGLVVAFLAWKYNVIWVRKGGSSSDNWDDGSAQRQPKSIWPCLRV